jgi:ribosomal-protein-alanine N-acetyltransferase
LLPERISFHPVVLRPFRPDDAPRVKLLAGDSKVAETTSLIPHPYDEGMAQAWIQTHAGLRDRGIGFVYAIDRADVGLLVGAIEVRLGPDAPDTLGYWVGRPYWGHGYATAAARAIIALSFSYLDCNQITASHLARNPASARVLEKCGLVLVRRQQREHRGKLEEFCVRGVTRDAWEQQMSGNAGGRPIAQRS